MVVVELGRVQWIDIWDLVWSRDQLLRFVVINLKIYKVFRGWQGRENQRLIFIFNSLEVEVDWHSRLVLAIWKLELINNQNHLEWNINGPYSSELQLKFVSVINFPREIVEGWWSDRRVWWRVWFDQNKYSMEYGWWLGIDRVGRSLIYQWSISVGRIGEMFQ